MTRFIMVSAGFDACTGHANALGGYEVFAPMFGFMTRTTAPVRRGAASRLALEGGYELSAISDAVEHCVKGADEDAGRLSADALEGIPCMAAQETIQSVIAIHKKHWPTPDGHPGHQHQRAAVADPFPRIAADVDEPELTPVF
ncbi:unnamed protein product, partial [Mesorhabditis spiculigera]